MVNRNLLRSYDLSDNELQQELSAVFQTGMDDWLPADERAFRDHQLVSGRVLRVSGTNVWIDVGYKSEGAVELQEWLDEATGQVIPPQPGDTVEVLLESVEDDAGTVVLSYRKAKRQKEWDAIIEKYKEGDVVSGVVTRKIKGGLLVNIGFPVFLPSSQVDVRRPSDLGHFLGKTVECKILTIDAARRNIVVSRRQFIEDQRATLRQRLLTEIQPGQIRTGVVKNITEFGAFVDLGGMDGLLHVKDMSWEHVGQPHDLVQIDQTLEVYVISVDREKGRIALGLKQKTANPWDAVEAKFPPGSRVTGQVVKLMPYGAFVKLEPGIEGLVHISEMSWTKRINHPSEILAIGDPVEVQVLNINRDKQEISLGLKQAQPNPWDKVAEKYPPETVVTGTVRNLTNYGAFIEIEEGIDGLLHVSDMSHVRKVSHPSEIVAKGDKVTCKVLNVDQERKRIALGLKQMSADPWETDIPGRYHPGDIKKGKVTKLTNFGVFVELEQGLEGLLHISELADHKVESPEEVVKLGDEVEVKVLRVDVADRKIGLSRKRLHETEPAPAEGEAAPAATPAKPARERELRGGTGSGGSVMISLSKPEGEPPASEPGK